MVAHWKHIDKSQREAISRMLSGGDRLKEIARNLGMHPTALSMEIRRNRAKTKPGEGKSRHRLAYPGLPRDYPGPFGKHS